jgi:hypothetical protein
MLDSLSGSADFTPIVLDAADDHSGASGLSGLLRWGSLSALTLIS